MMKCKCCQNIFWHYKFFGAVTNCILLSLTNVLLRKISWVSRVPWIIKSYFWRFFYVCMSASFFLSLYLCVWYHPNSRKIIAGRPNSIFLWIMLFLLHICTLLSFGYTTIAFFFFFYENRTMCLHESARDTLQFIGEFFVTDVLICLDCCRSMQPYVYIHYYQKKNFFKLKS